MRSGLSNLQAIRLESWLVACFTASLSSSTGDPTRFGSQISSYRCLDVLLQLMTGCVARAGVGQGACEPQQDKNKKKGAAFYRKSILTFQDSFSPRAARHPGHTQKRASELPGFSEPTPRTLALRLSNCRVTACVTT